MNRSILVLLAAATMTLTSRAMATVDTASARAEVARKVYISATDAKGAPVTDLTAADITVKEGGKEQPVASLEPAVAPMQVAILVDDAGTGAFQSAVAQFLQKSLGHGQFSISLLSPQAAKIVDFTEDVAALKNALGRLGARGRLQPDGDQMLEAIADSAKTLQQRKAERPVILAMTAAGGQPHSIEPQNVLTALRLSGATLNVLFVTGADLGMVMGDGPKLSVAGTGAFWGADASNRRGRVLDALPAPVPAHLHAAGWRQDVRPNRRDNVAQRPYLDFTVADRGQVTHACSKIAPPRCVVGRRGGSRPERLDSALERQGSRRLDNVDAKTLSDVGGAGAEAGRGREIHGADRVGP